MKKKIEQVILTLKEYREEKLTWKLRNIRNE